MEQLGAQALIFFISSFKFLSGLVAAFVHPTMDLLPSYVLTVGGGIAGVFAFIFFGDAIKRLFKIVFPKKSALKFSSFNRKMVRIRQRVGVPGIAMMTPILSIPIGIFLALSVSKNKPRIIAFMILSFFIWSSVFFLPKYIFGLNLYESISNLF